MFRSITLLMLILAAALLVNAESLWTKDSRSLYTDHCARNVGDILLVAVTQESSSTTQSKHTTSKGVNASANRGSGLFDTFAGFGVKADRGTSGAGASSSTTSILDHIAVRVAEVLPNGLLKIEGTRSIKLEKDEMLLSITGVIRTEDIQPDNTISSLMIADQKLLSKGVGPIAEKQRPGLFSALLSFLW